VAEQWRARVEWHAITLDTLTERDVVGRCRNRRDTKRLKAVQRLARAKEREANARRDYAHKVSRSIVNRYDVIALEDLRLTAMTASAKGTREKPGRSVAAKSGLNRAMLDAGLGQLETLIRERAAWAARTVIGVDAKYTSQTCAECGHLAKESREGPRFACVRCHHQDDADVNAARVILLRAECRPREQRASLEVDRATRPDHAHFDTVSRVLRAAPPRK
jgi:putative transposase